MSNIFLDFFWLSSAEKTIGCFFGLFKLGHGLTTYKAYNSMISNIKIDEKIFSDSFDGPQRLNIFSFKNKRSHYTSIYGYKYNVIIGLI